VKVAEWKGERDVIMEFPKDANDKEIQEVLNSEASVSARNDFLQAALVAVLISCVPWAIFFTGRWVVRGFKEDGAVQPRSQLG
jgi:hypothetical protein